VAGPSGAVGVEEGAGLGGEALALFFEVSAGVEAAHGAVDSSEEGAGSDEFLDAALRDEEREVYLYEAVLCVQVPEGKGGLVPVTGKDGGVAERVSLYRDGALWALNMLQDLLSLFVLGAQRGRPRKV
jgi:hypothetical protein